MATAEVTTTIAHARPVAYSACVIGQSDDVVRLSTPRAHRELKKVWKEVRYEGDNGCVVYRELVKHLCNEQSRVCQRIYATERAIGEWNALGRISSADSLVKSFGYCTPAFRISVSSYRDADACHSS